jgi:hypothetical protein
MLILNKNIEFVRMFYYCLNSFSSSGFEFLFARFERQKRKAEGSRHTRAGLLDGYDNSLLIAEWSIASLPLSGQFFASLRRMLGSVDGRVEVNCSWKSGKQP